MICLFQIKDYNVRCLIFSSPEVLLRCLIASTFQKLSYIYSQGEFPKPLSSETSTCICGRQTEGWKYAVLIFQSI